MKDTVAIFPGRFQLPHKGHKKVYDELVRAFGKCFIATSDIVSTKNNSPLNFKEKKRLLIHLGIPSDVIIKTRQPYRPVEVYKKIPKSKSVVIGIGSKDRERFGSLSAASYFKDYKSADKLNLKPWPENVYLMYIPTYRFTFMGESIKSGTQLRWKYVNLSHEKQKEFIFKLYETYHPQIHAMLSKRLEIYYD